MLVFLINRWLLFMFFSLNICCPDDFFRASPDTCLHIADPVDDSMAEYCQNKGSKLLGRPLDDDEKQSLHDEMKRLSENAMPKFAFFGLHNDAEEDAWGRSSDQWHFEGESTHFPYNKYYVWYKDPEEKKYCAVTGTSVDFKSLASDCNQQIPFLCQKDGKPCFEKGLPYMQYMSMCLALMPDPKPYSFAKSECEDGGHLAHLRKEEQVESFYQVFYNFRFAGGVYIGLKKNTDGKWAYLNKKQELQEFAQDDTQEFDCGGYRLVRNGSVDLYTLPCFNDTLHFICEISNKTNDEVNEEDSIKRGAGGEVKWFPSDFPNEFISHDAIDD